MSCNYNSQRHRLCNAKVTISEELKALGLIPFHFCDGISVLKVLKEIAQEDDINPEDVAQFKAALVQFGTAS